MPRDRLSFSIGVGGKINQIRFFGRIDDVLDDFRFAADHFVGRLEIIFQIDAQIAFGKILDMPDRRHDLKIFPQIFFQGLGLRGRFNDD